MIKMHFDLIPKNLKDQLDFYNFKLREFKILTKSLKVKNLQIPIWLISECVYYSRTIRQLKKELGV